MSRKYSDHPEGHTEWSEEHQCEIYWPPKPDWKREELGEQPSPPQWEEEKEKAYVNLVAEINKVLEMIFDIEQQEERSNKDEEILKDLCEEESRLKNLKADMWVERTESMYPRGKDGFQVTEDQLREHIYKEMSMDVMDYKKKPYIWHYGDSESFMKIPIEDKTEEWREKVEWEKESKGIITERIIRAQCMEKKYGVQEIKELDSTVCIETESVLDKAKNIFAKFKKDWRGCK